MAYDLHRIQRWSKIQFLEYRIMVDLVRFPLGKDLLLLNEDVN